ncbi:phosphoadenylyl-sulfate reductase [Rhodanobacter sp. MP7CTX1]|uniref:phosphoadenylyl-sulfate reductase n=1 Tax=Rhodanobacter sp. MP7CTX1 TaxID=2723084 RepID=UPI00161A6612|nr:phosphoadenylyl-sulfate reductase [Rhodanobacter sp. MP7CTX1]MBB6187672.1 phosphoadenosine phosphosulfate reductase [Rhodanobacter sp. MP7CTX1]
MSALDLPPKTDDPRALKALNTALAKLGAEERVAWALEHTPGQHVLSSSFGAQSAVSLHLVTRQQPDIPVVLIDTGYLFPETYRFIDELSERFALNLKVYRPRIGISWMEARYGRLWEQGLEGLDRYNSIRKVEPMQRALDELGATGWFAGLRRSQSRSRSDIAFVECRNDRWKFHPLADWSDRDVGMYLQRHGLPYHPLWEKGYVSIGDIHTSRRWEPGMDPEDTRFFGLKRECGLHSIA